jgi:hypothetical protein
VTVAESAVAGILPLLVQDQGVDIPGSVDKDSPGHAASIPVPLGVTSELLHHQLDRGVTEAVVVMPGQQPAREQNVIIDRQGVSHSVLAQ